MGSRERRERERADTRQLILDAAREMFVRVGYEATTMRAIAERIEYNPASIYHYFASKQVLLTELCMADMRLLARSFERAGRVTDPVERLEKIGEAYIAFGTKNPMQYQLMFLTPRPDVPTSPGVGEPPGDPSQDAYSLLLVACEEAIRTGRLRPEFGEAHQVAQIVWAGWHGLVSLHIVHGRDRFMRWRDLHATARQLHQALMSGLLRAEPG